MYKKIDKKSKRLQRHYKIRKKISGTPDKPRLEVLRSNSHIYAIVVDDLSGTTLASASTVDKSIKEGLTSTSNKEAAKKVGTIVAKRAMEKGINEVVFDRGGLLYHGKVKELADAAREAGLKF